MYVLDECHWIPMNMTIHHIFVGEIPWRSYHLVIVAASGGMGLHVGLRHLRCLRGCPTGQRPLRSGRQRSEWDSVDVCLGKKSDVCLGFYKGRQWKIWDFTRKNVEVIKIIDKCVNQCYLGVSILDLPHSDRFNMMLFEHRIPSHLMVEVLPIYRQTH